MVVQIPVMFEGAANISQGEIKAYRRFAFPPALGDSTHDPFFSVEHAPDWITSRGYQLYLEHDDGGEAVGSWNPDNATPTQVRAYRAHPGQQHCPYSHILDGKIRAGRIVHRKCSTQMIMFVPVDKSSPIGRKTLVIPRNPHNHPTHPKTKPSADDRTMLSRAVEAISVVGLTPQNLLNASSTALVYEGQRVASVSPAFMDNRKVRKFSEEQKRKDYPRGMGTKEPLLPKSERYIHTVMSKNGFKLVVTMQPQIASYMHNTLALNIDFTFKRVDGTMNEWEVAGMTDRFNRRLTFGSLFCDTSLNLQDLPQRSERQLWNSSFSIPTFLSSSTDVLDQNEQFKQSGITDNDLEMNSYNPTEDFPSYLDDPVFLRNLEMGATSLNMEADLPQLPMPMPSSPIAESTFRIS
ncbi:hypothetical protein B0H13DRAFT_1894316 [Mycena leptocephala]|nr:hypothetical protein B0H13DRAFT_1894316 [Mycena leptocephala]